MTLPLRISNHNFYAFLWHAGFLALAQSFMDVDTVIPAMVIDSGGKAMHIGIMTAIMLGGSSFTQLFFAPYISNKIFKKKYLLTGINVRVFSLFALAAMLFSFQQHQPGSSLWLIFLLITLFSVGGAFTNISYTDIFGKSVNADKRKTFFSSRQIISGTIILISAFSAKKIISSFDYPENYGYLFLFGGGLLLMASAGFWQIREETPSVLKITGLKHYIAILKTEMKQNRKLAYFLGFINTHGIVISFLPFVMLYAVKTFNIQNSDTGNYLLFKVLGVVFISLIVFFTAQKIRYNTLLYLNLLLSLTLVLFTLLAGNETSLRYVFILGGIVYSLFSITMNGLLLEVSGKENRALYTGLAGAGNVLPAIFPLAGGWIITQVGYQSFFFLFIVIISSSGYFIYKIGCQK